MNDALRPLLFPTCVGMNRNRVTNPLLQDAVPHVRGDEPRCMPAPAHSTALFPTCVGMNRLRSAWRF